MCNNIARTHHRNTDECNQTTLTNIANKVYSYEK